MTYWALKTWASEASADIRPSCALQQAVAIAEMLVENWLKLDLRQSYAGIEKISLNGGVRHHDSAGIGGSHDQWNEFLVSGGGGGGFANPSRPVTGVLTKFKELQEQLDDSLKKQIEDLKEKEKDESQSLKKSQPDENESGSGNGYESEYIMTEVEKGIM